MEYIALNEESETSVKVMKNEIALSAVYKFTSYPCPQRTQCASITCENRLMLKGNKIWVCCENYMEYVNALCRKLNVKIQFLRNGTYKYTS
jgi:hypothetical protein